VEAEDALAGYSKANATADAEPTYLAPAGATAHLSLPDGSDAAAVQAASKLQMASTV